MAAMLRSAAGLALRRSRFTSNGGHASSNTRRNVCSGGRDANEDMNEFVVWYRGIFRMERKHPEISFAIIAGTIMLAYRYSTKEQCESKWRSKRTIQSTGQERT